MSLAVVDDPVQWGQGPSVISWSALAWSAAFMALIVTVAFLLRWLEVRRDERGEGGDTR